MSKLYPLEFEPIYKEYVWGGDSLQKLYSRSKPCAESWEISDREDGMSIVKKGEFQGKSLHELIQMFKTDLLGRNFAQERFPLLIKLIDAKKDLSIQVHPGHEIAQKLQSEPKTECWYILKTEPDAYVYAGFQNGKTQKDLLSALQSGNFDAILQKHKVHPGDLIFVPAGTIHSIMAGCVLLEVQQNSNTTYRVYDWGRGRELHLTEALASIQFLPGEQLKIEPKISDQSEHFQRQIRLECDDFNIEELIISHSWICPSRKDRAEVIFCVEGKGIISKEELYPGKTLLIPAVCAPLEITSYESSLKLIRILL